MQFPYQNRSCIDDYPRWDTPTLLSKVHSQTGNSNGIGDELFICPVGFPKKSAILGGDSLQNALQECTALLPSLFENASFRRFSVFTLTP